MLGKRLLMLVAVARLPNESKIRREAPLRSFGTTDFSFPPSSSKSVRQIGASDAQFGSVPENELHIWSLGTARS